MEVTCSNPPINFAVYHVGDDHYFVAVIIGTGCKIEAHIIGDDWEARFYKFIDTIIHNRR